MYIIIYKDRKSPPYPANENCNKKKKGNDSLMYISTPNKNDVCSWKKCRLVLLDPWAKFP